MTYKTSSKNQNWLLPPSIKSMIPEDHICFFVEEFVDNLDFSEFDEKFSGAGAPAYQRRILMKIFLQGMLGHKSPETSMIYTHGTGKMIGVKSPIFT
jgi:transposase